MESKTPTSILIVKTSAIGDVLQTFAALQYLRLKFPKSRIDWVVEQPIAPLLMAHPHIDHVIPIHSRLWRKKPLSSQTRAEFSSSLRKLRSVDYELLFDLQGNTKSALVTALANAKVKVGFGWRSAREKCNLLVTDKRFDPSSFQNRRRAYLEVVQSYFEDTEPMADQAIPLRISDEEGRLLHEICQKKERLTLMICFGSRWPNKRLKHSTLIAFLEKVAAEYDPIYVFVFGDEQEKLLAEQLASHFDASLCVGDLSLPLWQALMWKMDGVIAVDSAALHLCATTPTPSFGVFGPSAASCYKPPGQRHAAIQGVCPYGRTFSSHCPILRTCPTGACIQELHPEALFASCQKWLRTQLAKLR